MAPGSPGCRSRGVRGAVPESAAPSAPPIVTETRRTPTACAPSASRRPRTRQARATRPTSDAAVRRHRPMTRVYRVGCAAPAPAALARIRNSFRLLGAIRSDRPSTQFREARERTSPRESDHGASCSRPLHSRGGLARGWPGDRSIQPTGARERRTGVVFRAALPRRPGTVPDQRAHRAGQGSRQGGHGHSTGHALRRRADARRQHPDHRRVEGALRDGASPRVQLPRLLGLQRRCLPAWGHAGNGHDPAVGTAAVQVARRRRSRGGSTT